MTDEQKLCFVVMGFGKKTDFESGRTFDLDATYDAIIRPAVEQAGLRCIRADEIKQSGLIDVPMYEMLLRANLVIADISTANPNALYELGVRHALCPNSTIVMKEAAGKLYFDLNHISTFQYQHLGEDIGAREATRASAELRSLIDAALAFSGPDSPVYTFMPRLRRPTLSDKEFAERVDEMEDDQDRLARLLKQGAEAGKASKHDIAAQAFDAANKLKPNDSYILQQLALHTYKAGKPDKIAALHEGLKIISALKPAESNDPETRGITGAMHKRLWLATHDPAQLDLAILHYRRGFDVRGDYYNGENLATCYDMRAQVQQDPAEQLFDSISARKVREQIVDDLTAIVASAAANERSDLMWIYATLSNCLYALGQTALAEGYEKQFRARVTADWEADTFEDGKAAAIEVAQRAQTKGV